MGLFYIRVSLLCHLEGSLGRFDKTNQLQICRGIRDAYRDVRHAGVNCAGKMESSWYQNLWYVY